ncbi:MAG: phosphatase PAP2 family protein [Bacteroidales bacterium]|jgi:undecaprenyl-diphosphatase|nr:phosphatase PAP2 family protein [Bacteroidales bacterium]MCI2121929.1 phosphatase PAP2 family protein [Bacteroidales bacterium]MCI2145460.1 phosphatase PAP2 family protein [Bacteroidales bacterium]
MTFTESITGLDGKLFLILNGAHARWLDPVMMVFSNREIWLVLYIGVLVFISKKKDLKTMLLALAFMILTVTVTDQACDFIKMAVGRLRPSHSPQLNGIVNLLEDSGGLYGFPSNHAADVFGYAILTSMILKCKPYTAGIVVWAALVSYSRIYVGKHYPLDVLAGAALGIAAGFAMYLLFVWIRKIMFGKDKKRHAIYN